MVGSGLSGQVGVAQESAYGVYAAPTSFWECNTESYSKTMGIVQGGGPAAGRPAQAASRRVVTTEAASGSHQMEVPQSGFGIWLRNLFGSATNPVKQGSTAAYLQTHALGDNFGRSLSLQVGVPTRAGGVVPKTIKGGKISSIEFECGAGELLTCTVEMDGQRYSEVETLAAASYPSPSPQAFHFLQMSLKLGVFGSETIAQGVKKVTMKLERPMSDDDYYAGSTIPGTKDEPVWNDWFAVSGTVETDYKDKSAFVDRWHLQQATSMVWDFNNGAAPIGAGYNPQFTLTAPAVFFTDGTPQVQGNEVVGISFPFVGQFDPTNGQVSARYQSTDVTIV